eukprot:CAMPEP_0119107720 /NCGR_PEP_ID=MMETSP1180-20130426/11565_1 /TAXON_ID=3052 ORGANISM="Chlamydomonas cf sp, Strain CCMP681" /NCGR_SAMPLE_ID=MMETSP1180 /ASSEMBLY_ACC=CAM_ASM_000741 /LENGTH=275 /DNA_ID=CAMNT_0007093253 /DNA_START=90 /DNA_END=917 /DNA_ORIENTATION=+
MIRHLPVQGRAWSPAPVCATTRAVSLARHAGLSQQVSRPVLQHQQLVARAAEDVQGPGEGDLQVQAGLVDVLKLEVAKAKVKDDMLQDLETRKENMRRIGQELDDEFAKKIELDKMRMDLASNSSLADTYAEFKELDDQIQKIRDQLQVDQADLLAFEQRSAISRNDSLFFKGLHKGPPETAGAGSSQQGTGNAQSNQQAAKVVANISAVGTESETPLRLYLFTYFGIACLFLAGSDLMSPTGPNLWLDGGYTIVGVGLGFQAWRERVALTTGKL